MPLHPQRQRLDPGENQKSIEGRQCRPHITQAEDAAGDGKGEIAERFVQNDALVFGTRLAKHRIFFVPRPIERSAVDDQSADRIAVAAKKFCERVHDDVGAKIDWLAQVGRRERVVDDQRHAGLTRDFGNRLDVRYDTARICDRLDEDAFRLRSDRFFKAGNVVRIRPHDVPAKILERMIELVDRPAVQLFRCDKFVARRHQRVHHENLCGVAGGDGQSRSAALKRPARA